MQLQREAAVAARRRRARLEAEAQPEQRAGRFGGHEAHAEGPQARAAAADALQARPAAGLRRARRRARVDGAEALGGAVDVRGRREAHEQREAVGRAWLGLVFGLGFGFGFRGGFG